MTDTSPQIASTIKAKLEAVKVKRANGNTEPYNPALLADGLPPTGFIRLPQVLELIPISKAVWWDGIKQGRYPAGVKIGARATAWRVEDIRELIQNLGAVE